MKLIQGSYRGVEVRLRLLITSKVLSHFLLSSSAAALSHTHLLTFFEHRHVFLQQSRPARSH